MKRIVLVLQIILCVINANAQQQVVRLSAEREAWLSGDRQSALELLLKKEASGDQSNTTLYNIGYLYTLNGDYAKALTYFQTVLVKKPPFPYAYLQIARIHVAVGNLHAAYENLRKGLEKDSENIDLLLEMADVLHSLKMTDKESDVYEDILDLDEDNVPAIVGVSRILRQKGKTAEAREILEDNPTIYPEALILQEKARVYRKLGRQETSRDFLVNILKDYPNSSRWASIRDTLRLKYRMEKVPEPEKLPTYPYKFNPTEELDYKVGYGPIALGWLKVRFAKPETLQGKQVYPIRFFVDSNPDYSFIMSLHHIYESYLEPGTMNVLKSRLYTPGSDLYLARVYTYDYDKNLFESYAIHPDGRFSYLIKDIPRKVQDSTSMLFFARGLVSSKQSGFTTVVIDEEYKYGYINFLNETEKIVSDKKEVNAIKIFARAEFKGIAGMNGEAWGWFSLDNQVVPLKGAIEIIIGSITVEIDEAHTVVPDFHKEARN